MKDAAAVTLGILAALSVLGGWAALGSCFDMDAAFDCIFWPYNLLALIDNNFIVGALVLPAMCLQVLTACLVGVVLFGTAAGVGVFTAAAVMAL